MDLWNRLVGRSFKEGEEEFSSSGGYVNAESVHSEDDEDPSTPSQPSKKAKSNSGGSSGSKDTKLGTVLKLFGARSQDNQTRKIEHTIFVSNQGSSQAASKEAPKADAKATAIMDYLYPILESKFKEVDFKHSDDLVLMMADLFVQTPNIYSMFIRKLGLDGEEAAWAWLESSISESAAKFQSLLKDHKR